MGALVLAMAWDCRLEAHLWDWVAQMEALKGKCMVFCTCKHI